MEISSPIVLFAREGLNMQTGSSLRKVAAQVLGRHDVAPLLKSRPSSTEDQYGA